MEYPSAGTSEPRRADFVGRFSKLQFWPGAHWRKLVSIGPKLGISQVETNMAEVIPRQYWVNPNASFTASIYGAVPAGEGWVIETSGYTIRWDDGTVGLPHRYSRTDGIINKQRAEEILQESLARGFKGFRG
jgi:hypothetical protein